MKIASTLTNTAPSETGLPSLLSCGPSTGPSSLDAAPAPTDANKADSAQAGQSITAFDAVLAMFNVPQNLPQQSPPLPAAQPTAANATALTASALSVPNIAATPALGGDVALSRPEQIAPPLVTSRLPAPSPTVLATSSTVSTVAFNNEQGPSTALPAIADSTAVAVRDGQQSQPVSQVLEAAMNSPKPATASTEISATTQSTYVESSVPSAIQSNQSSVVVPLPVLEPHSQHTSLTISARLDEPNSATKAVVSIDSPALSVTTSVVSNTQPPCEFSAISGRFFDSRQENLEDRNLRHRHVATDSRVTSELAVSTIQPTEVTDRGPQQLNVPQLAEQISAAVQTHGHELAGGQPVEVHLRLDPPELGMVRVHLRLSNDAVSVRFIAGDEAATKMLESQLPDLRQSLAERGLAFAQCNVSCDSRQQQSSNFGRQDGRLPFVPTPVRSRSWSQPSFVTRSVSAHIDHINILA